MGQSFKYALKATTAACGAVAALAAAPAFAQDTAEARQEVSSAGDDIVVTARKRNETAIDVPVAIVALSKADLDRYNTRDFVSLASQVPGMIVQPIPGGGGGSVVLRGVSSTPLNPSIDQAVSFNIDGVQVGSANIIRLGQIDLQQIEILKGPQALFFGKNSPGGIITLRTADPTSNFEGRARVTHEFNARETSGELMVSGPVTDTLGVRAVAYYTKMRGYVDNLAQTILPFAYGPTSSHGPKRSEVYFRVTALYQPTDTLTVRAKYNYGYLTSDSSPFDTQQRIFCPNGAPQLNGYPGTVECKPDDRATTGTMNPVLRANYGQLFPFEGLRARQQLASLEVNYEVVPDINFTSVTGYYKIYDSFYGSASYQSGTPLISGTVVHRRELSQELRLSTDKQDWPINFTVGAYFQDTNFRQGIPTIIDAFALGRAPAPGTVGSISFNEFSVPGKAHSFFGQAVWDIFDELELAGGVRWSKEKKSVTGFQNRGLDPSMPGAPRPIPLIPTFPKVSYTDTSPEVTLTYKPTPDLSFFGAWRNGFKSGGFSTAGSFALSGVDIRYEPEDVKGFEGGVKARIGDLRFNATAYTYKYSNLQLGTFDPIILLQKVINAGSARVKGLEADVSWRPSAVQGLQLRGAINYNHARYLDFLPTCYTGQTFALGCNTVPNAALVIAMRDLGFNPASGAPFPMVVVTPGAAPVQAAYRQQNFAGRQLNLAPDWTANAGFTYEVPVGDLKLGLTGDASYSSSFHAQLEQAPFNKQKDYWMFNASVRMADIDDTWEVALIGQNLTEEYRARFVSQTPLTGIASRTGTNATGGFSDTSGQVNRGREIRLQLTYNFR